MELAVLIQEQPKGGFRAWTPALRPYAATAPTREQAVAGLRCLIADVRPSAALVLIDVAGTKPNPLLEMAGIFADDETLEPMLKEIYAARDAGRPID